MRYATTSTWVYSMLIVMGLGFLGGAAAFIIYAPPPTGEAVGAIWALIGAGFVFFSVRAIRGGRDDDRIRRDGTAATATLLAASSTGVFINNVPRWKLRLRIDGAGASYETTMKLCTYSPPGNGATLAVRVDPVHREHVVLTDDDAAAPAAAGAPGGLAGIQSGDLGTAIAAALAQVGRNGATTTTMNADALRQAQDDGRTITMGATTIDGVPAAMNGAGNGAADTVRLLDDLDRMHTSGALGDIEFDTLKRKLLGTE